jgi:predicted translin family RNA/ssDNA-binding protein
MDAQNAEEWKRIAAEMDAFDDNRERVIKEMREVQKVSKTSIYALHRGEKVADKLARAEQVIRSFEPIVKANPELRRGTFSAALEEYVEARSFEYFLWSGKLMPLASFGGLVDNEEYLGGVADLTGELIRYAVLQATNRNVEAVRKCRKLADDLLVAFMQLSLRNGLLRKKSDSIKYALKRCEEILYELSLVPEGKRLNAAAFDEEKQPEQKKAKTEGGEDE